MSFPTPEVPTDYPTELGSTRIFEVLERHQPHGMGWSEPPPTSHGLFESLAGATRKAGALSAGGHEVIEIVPRELHR